MAVAMKSVLQTKYVVAAPPSGSAIDHENSAPGTGPPNQVYTSPVIFTVSTSDAMLKSVRCTGERVCVRKVHWLQALVAATNIVASARSSSSAAKSTAYDTDMVEPLEVSGRFTFNADASDEKTSRTKKRVRLGRCRSASGPKRARTAVPAISTAATYRRAAMVSSFTGRSGRTLRPAAPSRSLQDP